MWRNSSLDDFVLLKRLALGAMSEVFLAEVKGAQGPDRLVALKRMRPEVAGDEAWVRQFLDEAHLASLLNHPFMAGGEESPVTAGPRERDLAVPRHTPEQARGHTRRFRSYRRLRAPEPAAAPVPAPGCPIE